MSLCKSSLSLKSLLQNGWNAGELQPAGSYTTEDSLSPNKNVTAYITSIKGHVNFASFLSDSSTSWGPLPLQLRMFQCQETVTLANRSGGYMGLSVVTEHLRSAEPSLHQELDIVEENRATENHMISYLTSSRRKGKSSLFLTINCKDKWAKAYGLYNEHPTSLTVACQDQCCGPYVKL